MSEINEFMIQQIIDNGKNVQISLVENVNTEPISQKQMIRESVIKNIDKETKDQVMPLLDAILPTIKIKSYQHTSITVTMPKILMQVFRPRVSYNESVVMNNTP